MLSDSWDSIWNHDRALWLREKRYAPQACQGCSVLAECGGGCPLTLINQTDESIPQPLHVLPLAEASPGG